MGMWNVDILFLSLMFDKEIVFLDFVDFILFGVDFGFGVVNLCSMFIILCMCFFSLVSWIFREEIDFLFELV